MDGEVTDATDDERFSSSGHHDPHPQRLFVPPLGAELRELAHVVDFHLLAGTTQLARIGDDSFDKFSSTRCAAGRGPR